MGHKLKARNIMITTLQEEKFKQLSNETGLTISELIRRALDKYLAEEVRDGQ